MAGVSDNSDSSSGSVLGSERKMVVHLQVSELHREVDDMN